MDTSCTYGHILLTGYYGASAPGCDMDMRRTVLVANIKHLECMGERIYNWRLGRLRPLREAIS